MQIRFLLHSFGEKGGGVRTVLYAVAQELAKEHDVELVALYGHRMEGTTPPAGSRWHLGRGSNGRDCSAGRSAASRAAPLHDRSAAEVSTTSTRTSC